MNMIRIFAKSLILGAPLVFFPGSVSWSCEQGGCNNHPTETASPEREAIAVPYEIACNTSECRSDQAPSCTTDNCKLDQSTPYDGKS